MNNNHNNGNNKHGGEKGCNSSNNNSDDHYGHDMSSNKHYHLRNGRYNHNNDNTIISTKITITASTSTIFPQYN